MITGLLQLQDTLALQEDSLAALEQTLEARLDPNAVLEGDDLGYLGVNICRLFRDLRKDLSYLIEHSGELQELIERPELVCLL